MKTIFFFCLYLKQFNSHEIAFPLFWFKYFCHVIRVPTTKTFQNVCFRSLRADCGCWQPDGIENLFYFRTYSADRALYTLLCISMLMLYNDRTDVCNVIANVVMPSIQSSLD